MSVLNDGNNLPGVLIDYEKEISQDFDPSQFGTTDAVLIIGTAFSGTPGIATKLYNPEMAEYMYGGIYDEKTHRSASLVAAVKDAYERGCRTIYGMRVGGKEIYKDFKFCDDFTGYRLRLRGMYPTNIVKDCSLFLDLRSGIESLKFYKPAAKATIAEMKSGAVSSEDAVMVNSIELNEEGLTRDSKLTDLIEAFNNHPYNNVLELLIVDEDGNDVTTTSEAQAIKVGSCYSGVYFIGRDISNVASYTTLLTTVCAEDQKPYASYEGMLYRQLKFNSDVSAPYPIYASVYDDMKAVLYPVSVTSSTSWDFLETSGLADRAFAKDEIDYEEVDMSKFEMYKALGEGFATTAKAVSRGISEKTGLERKPRVIETPADDPNHVVPVRDGIYTIAQLMEAKYRVVVGINADDKIADHIPVADDFKVATSNAAPLLGQLETGEDALIIAQAKVDSEDFTLPKKYSFEFHLVDEEDILSDNIEEIYQDKVATVIAGIEQGTAASYGEAVINAIGEKNTIAKDTKVMVFDASGVGHLMRYINNDKVDELANVNLKDELYCVSNNMYIGVLDTNTQQVSFKPLKADENPLDPVTNKPTAADGTEAYAQFTYKKMDYMLIESLDTVYAAEIVQDSSATSGIMIDPIGPLDVLVNGNNDETLIYTEDLPFGTSHIVVTTAATEFMPLEEFAALLNEDPALKKIFSFELTEAGTNQKDEYLEDLVDSTGIAGSVKDNAFIWVDNAGTTHGKVYTLAANKNITYDYSKYIPYKTSDNFARQLAQHCAYTTLRTANTHGFIGLSPIKDLSLKSIDSRVETVYNDNFNLYAKNYLGQNLLLPNREKYEIGSRISIPMVQYDISDNNGFTFKSNGAAGYAGMVSTLPITQSSTAQPISIAQGVDYVLSYSQLQKLTSKGVVTISNSNTKGLVVTDGTTMASSSQYAQRLMVQRILDRCGEVIRAAGEPFIGKVNNMDNRNALKTAIDSALHDLVGVIIYTYDFNITNLSSFTADSQIDISYNIFPINEIRSINNQITIKKSA